MQPLRNCKCSVANQNKQQHKATRQRHTDMGVLASLQLHKWTSGQLDDSADMQAILSLRSRQPITPSPAQLKLQACPPHPSPPYYPASLESPSSGNFIQDGMANQGFRGPSSPARDVRSVCGPSSDLTQQYLDDNTLDNLSPSRFTEPGYRCQPWDGYIHPQVRRFLSQYVAQC
jgi:hypothetical protein